MTLKHYRDVFASSWVQVRSPTYIDSSWGKEIVSNTQALDLLLIGDSFHIPKHVLSWKASKLQYTSLKTLQTTPQNFPYTPNNNEDI